MARWTKKSLVFAITGATEQVAFIDQLKRKIKLNFQVSADQRGLTVTIRGDPERVKHAIKRVQQIYRDQKEAI